MNKFGSKNKSGNPRIYGIHVFRIISPAIHFFCSGLRGCGYGVFPAATASRFGNGKLDMYYCGFPLCCHRIYPVQRNAGRKVSGGIYQVRNINAEETALQEYQYILADYAAGGKREKKRKEN